MINKKKKICSKTEVVTSSWLSLSMYARIEVEIRGEYLLYIIKFFGFFFNLQV
jgi:hypothetical protein